MIDPWDFLEESGLYKKYEGMSQKECIREDWYPDSDLWKYVEYNLKNIK